MFLRHRATLESSSPSEAAVSNTRALPVVTLTWNDIDALSRVMRRQDPTELFSGVEETTCRDESFIKEDSGNHIYQVCSTSESTCPQWLAGDFSRAPAWQG